ncbi:MAG TPA: cytochrome P450, partial [Thermoanaerobaculia bacterium]|nr:cytochrome P450 [Thermoanaerobaculia bacterium]
ERLARPGDRGDVLSVLLGYGDLPPGCEPLDTTAARDEIVTRLAAGHETLACMLTWTWHLLAQTPDAERALHEEVDDVLDDCAFDASLQPRLPYTMSVMRESMRLYPPVWVNGRQAAADDEIHGRPVKRGDMFWTPAFLVHRDPRWYPDPLRFNPDRFLPEAAAARPRFAYFPYGGGNRQCVGQALAELEGPLLIAAIARAFAPCTIGRAAPELVPMITLQPKGGMPMRLVRRAATPRLLEVRHA